MDLNDFRQRLRGEREQFLARLRERSAPPDLASTFPRRIGVVLSGGGARGAYEAGALLAFQDAKLPTHLIAASSVGSINAACFASHSSTLVGDAEALIDTWAEISAAAVGIDWSRYVFMLAGLVAASAGFFNALRDWLDDRGIFLHATHPVFTWLALMLAGASLLLLYDQLAYVFYVLGNLLHHGRWRPDRGKAARSLAANLVVWGFVYLVLNFTHLHIQRNVVMQFEIGGRPLLFALVVLIAAWWFFVRERLSALSHKFLRLPLRTGLFANYERTKLFRVLISAQGLRDSPIRVVMTATDIAAGTAKYFINRPLAEIAADPKSHAMFVSAEIEQATDPVQAVVASSAFTIAYEAVPMEKRLWTDGGIVTNQPIRPAVRLGADILFLVMVEPLHAAAPTALRTFLDVGVRAIDILVTKNLIADLKLLSRVNAMCERFAAPLNLRPEQVELEVGDANYKFVKAFTVCPKIPLTATALDFNGEVTRPAILEGYRDGGNAVCEFLDYIAALPDSEEHRRIKLVAEQHVAVAKANL